MSGAAPPLVLRGLHAAIATKHGKERVLAAPLTARTGLHLAVAPGLDTDVLGTFTGETERPGSPLQTAVAKARLGMRAAGLPRAVASEGSFGPHPHAPLVAGGMELVVYVDDELGIEVAEAALSRRTTLGHTATARLDGAAGSFLERVRFPSHAVIVRPNAGEGAIVKGLRDAGALAAAITRAARESEDGLARIESDLRADRNPTRMAEIALVARRLADRLATPCPACGTPGYGVAATSPGLPCRDCGAPTPWIAYEVDGCARCGHTCERPRRDGLRAVEPAHCPACNP